MYKLSHVCQRIDVLVCLELEEAATLGDGHVNGKERHHTALLLLLHGAMSWMDRQMEGWVTWGG